MGHGTRVGRVGLQAVAVRGVGDARKADWDVGMFRRAGGGGQTLRLPARTAGGRPSVVELVRQLWVEHEVRCGFASVGSKAGV